MKLKDIQAGPRAIRRVPLPMMNTPRDFVPDLAGIIGQRAADQVASQPGSAPPAAPVPIVGLRVLTGEDTETVCEKAWAWAKAKGATAPNEDDPIYAVAVKTYTCAVACVDPDSDPARPDLFFGDNVEQAAENLRTSEIVGRDGIVYLAEQQETWQDLCSPQIAKLAPEEFMRKVGEVAASSDAGPFEELRPGTRWIFARTMALTLQGLLLPRLGPGGFSADTGTNSDSASESSEP